MNAPVKRRTDPERAQNRRNQVLQAAAVCFARSGFHAASMSEISKEAGMSAGHIYNYFDSKDAIIMAFVDLHAEDVLMQLGELDSRDDPLQAMIDDAPLHVDKHLDGKKIDLPLEMFAEAARNPKIAEALRTADYKVSNRFRPIIKRERERRGLAVDDALLDGRIDTMVSMFHGLSIRGIQRPDLNRTSIVEGWRVALTALLLT
ncbi:TetR family transcriptional regulator [Duganella sp. FT50W]|uniref:TetR family transcriptional regulator n=1 Tax=Duganella lactea TaxID=2692173 RepID=A0A6L8MKH1_9BURK|nr:TetR/AcrR family transcriptional regulator [Duganella lactea]MYM36245.1 TetR family transcriptional regulator [Duganella lactea]MYM82316.1 TetR family transcriptional regulator [Duganella lactea]